MARQRIEVLEIQQGKRKGILAFDPGLFPDPRLLTAVQEKYPAAEATHQRTYAQALTALKRNMKERFPDTEDTFDELELMFPSSTIDDILGRSG